MNKKITDFLVQNFNIENQSSEVTVDYLKQKLQERIKFFIQTDMDRLIQAFYRIDLSDQVTCAAFDLGEINKIAAFLSEAIIERQIKKIEYSRQNQ